MCSSNVTDPIRSSSGYMSFADSADATTGQKVSRNAFFQLTHASDSKTLTAIVLRTIRYSSFP
jgi:hypothetical protein